MCFRSIRYLAIESSGGDTDWLLVIPGDALCWRKFSAQCECPRDGRVPWQRSVHRRQACAAVLAGSDQRAQAAPLRLPQLHRNHLARRQARVLHLLPVPRRCLPPGHDGLAPEQVPAPLPVVQPGLLNFIVHLLSAPEGLPCSPAQLSEAAARTAGPNAKRMSGTLWQHAMVTRHWSFGLWGSMNCAPHVVEGQVHQMQWAAEEHTELAPMSYAGQNPQQQLWHAGHVKYAIAGV